MSDPRRLLVVGQVLGRHGVWDRVVSRALSERAEAVVALGNLFSRHGDTRSFLDHMDARCSALDIPVFFVDGPTDPFGMLDAHSSGRLSPRVTHLQRAASWSWAGIRFLAAGGGVTLDLVAARERGGWWPQEALAPAEMAACAEVGRVDVLLCFDAPWGINVADRYKGRDVSGLDPAVLVREVEHRKALHRIVERVQPQHVLCAPAGRSKGCLRFDGGGARPVEVRVDALGDPVGDDGCEIVDIRPPGPLDGAAILHPALGPDPDPEPGAVPHPAL